MKFDSAPRGVQFKDALQVVVVPARFRVPVAEYGLYAGLGGPHRLRRVPESGQCMQGVEAFSDTVRQKLVQWTVDLGPVERQGHGAAVGAERGSGVLFDRVLVETHSDCVFGVQQRIQVTARDMCVRPVLTKAQVRLGAQVGPEERGVVVVGAERAGHGPATQTYGVPDVRCVDAGKFHSLSLTLCRRTASENTVAREASAAPARSVSPKAPAMASARADSELSPSADWPAR